MLTYLSAAWIEAMDHAAQTLAPPDASVAVQVCVDSVAYYIVADDSGVRIRAGRHGAPDVTLQQSLEIAASVVSGGRSAQAAFISGDIRLSGDAEALMKARPVFEQLDQATENVRARTVL